MVGKINNQLDPEYGTSIHVVTELQSLNQYDAAFWGSVNCHGPHHIPSIIDWQRRMHITIHRVEKHSYKKNLLMF